MRDGTTLLTDLGIKPIAAANVRYGSIFDGCTLESSAAFLTSVDRCELSTGKKRLRRLLNNGATVMGSAKCPNQQEIVLRPYQASDREPVLQIWWESWHSSSGFKHPKPLHDWRDRWMLLFDRHRIVVAIDSKSESIVGFAALNVSESVLSQIFVSVDRKREGIGSILFAWAKEVSRGPLIVRTLATNIESRRFYERLGMIEFENSVNEFNGESVVGYFLVARTPDQHSE